jgi:hypothetical protein
MEIPPVVSVLYRFSTILGQYSVYSLRTQGNSYGRPCRNRERVQGSAPSPNRGHGLLPPVPVRSGLPSSSGSALSTKSRASSHPPSTVPPRPGRAPDSLRRFKLVSSRSPVCLEDAERAAFPVSAQPCRSPRSEPGHRGDEQCEQPAETQGALGGCGLAPAWPRIAQDSHAVARILGG